MTTISTAELLASSPAEPPFDTALTGTCIDACFECARACLVCADACMADPDLAAQLLACVRLDASCADVCEATGRVLARQQAIDPVLAQSVLQTCVAVTRLCAEECDSHAARHRHCLLCAQACRRCEDACRRLLAAMVSASGEPVAPRSTSGLSAYPST